MANQPTSRPSEAELEILQVLWTQKEATVKEVYEEISQKKNIQYTTTLKQMQRMQEKGLIDRTGSGKSFVYHALVKEEAVKNNLFNQLMDTAFKGSAIDLAMHALGNTKASPEELSELENWLEEMKKGGKP